MWLKLLLAGLVIAFCTLLGYFAAGKYRARKNFFSQWCDLNEKYLSELRYRRTPLPNFLKECKLSGEFGRAAQGALGKKQEQLKAAFLTEEEKRDALGYLGQLGRGDARSQLGYFEGKRAALLSKKEEAEKEAKERGELYGKLGLLAGLAFVILIV